MRKISKLSIIFFISITSSCDIILSDLQVQQVHIFSAQSNSFHDNKLNLCINIKKFDQNSHYMARLDYLPNVGLDAKNDNVLHAEGQDLKVSIQIRKRSEPLRIDKEKPQIYKFAVEVRKAQQTFSKLLVYRYIIHQYLPIVILIAIVSFQAERLLFSQTPIQQKLD